MSDPFLAEIKMWGGNFAPLGYANCTGQILPISQNTALFSLLGVNFGGNGTTNFGLPDFQGRAPMHAGTGNGLSPRSIGEEAGFESVTLQNNELAPHTHTLMGSTAQGTAMSPEGMLLALPAVNARFQQMYKAGDSNNVPMGNTNFPIMTPAGTGPGPHNNRQPSLAVTFVIAMQGVYPQRP